MAESVISQGEQGTSAGPVGSPAPVGKKIYITANTFYGSMNAPGGGKAAADANCMADVNYPGAGVYKALIGTADNIGPLRRVACGSANCGTGTASQYDWVLAANTSYIRAIDDAPLFTTDGNGIYDFAAPLPNSIGTSPGNYWTGIKSDWTVSQKNCTNWTTDASASNNNTRGRIADALALDATALALSPPVVQENCNVDYPLLCVEQ